MSDFFKRGRELAGKAGEMAGHVAGKAGEMAGDLAHRGSELAGQAVGHARENLENLSDGLLLAQLEDKFGDIGFTITLRPKLNDGPQEWIIALDKDRIYRGTSFKDTAEAALVKKIE